MSTDAEFAVDSALPKDFLRPCLLLLLRERPGHGYDLLRRLPPFGFEQSDPGRVYRTLRALERDGLVLSRWETSEDGPERRVYELTGAGMEELHRRARALDGTRRLMDAFLVRYEEFVTLALGGTEQWTGDRPAATGPRTTTREGG